ncbi:MAG: M42 family metallopeptidase [Promethearchaeota archaeon]
MEELKELFINLVAIDSPSGFEEPMMKKLLDELQPITDNVWDTPRGNIIGVQKGSDPKAPKIALAAHIDQIGFIVFSIDNKGFIRFRKIGGAVNRSIQGHQMKILTEKGPVYGVAGIKPGHITSPEEAKIVPPLEDLYIDIGANTKKEVLEKGVKVGCPIVWNTKPVELMNDFIGSPAADDRVGIAAIISIAKNLYKNKIPATVYYIGTVEEEIGLRGAEVALSGLDVDLAVAVDTCPSGYQPDVSQIEIFYEVGKGPALHIGKTGRSTRFSSPVLRHYLVKTAKDSGTPFQSGLVYGGNDAHAMQQTGQGLHACTLAIPRRYSHSPVEVFSLKDLYNGIKILTKAITGLDSKFNLHRI